MAIKYYTADIPCDIEKDYTYDEMKELDTDYLDDCFSDYVKDMLSKAQDKLIEKLKAEFTTFPNGTVVNIELADDNVDVNAMLITIFIETDESISIDEIKNKLNTICAYFTFSDEYELDIETELVSTGNCYSDVPEYDTERVVVTIDVTIGRDITIAEYED